MKSNLTLDERGGVSAEFAVALPALLLVVAVVVAALTMVTQRITLTSAAHDISRLEARGDASQAATRIAELDKGVTLERTETEGILCVTASQSSNFVVLQMITLTARGCAAVSDW